LYSINIYFYPDQLTTNMRLADAITLIEAADISRSSPATWADLGCGSGTFTYALAHLLAPKSKIYAVDKTLQRLQPTASNIVEVVFKQGDFEREALSFPPLDGILMANALHYVQDKASLIERLKTYLAKDGMFIIVEYDTLKANPWVPYPVDRSSLQHLFAVAGFANLKQLGERPSVYFNRRLYASQLKR
jgi:trans-aconitate methyltransferase